MRAASIKDRARYAEGERISSARPSRCLPVDGERIGCEKSAPVTVEIWKIIWVLRSVDLISAITACGNINSPIEGLSSEFLSRIFASTLCSCLLFAIFINFGNWVRMRTHYLLEMTSIEVIYNLQKNERKSLFAMSVLALRDSNHPYFPQISLSMRFKNHEYWFHSRLI